MKDRNEKNSEHTLRAEELVNTKGTSCFLSAFCVGLISYFLSSWVFLFVLIFISGAFLVVSLFFFGGGVQDRT